ncbi:CPBP family intramembrane metalloprotease [Paenibacillus albicereus]|uniref:CPBP family intramembrane metalloprotease n=1 Tax=Paenibacillus albicereus TaxID=2726185 RepID=A0A6H2H1L1_9BACL|nr:type II CAAX endopeptidase family protein [Paenibacillus albicereus]QJC53238.1 CPBP family intramembrane metalloprotease [Paenibacillus albicereus]
MNSSRLDQAFRRYVWYGAIGAALFLLLQVIPSAAGLGEEMEPAHPVSREQALAAAADFAQMQLGSLPQNAHAVHQADRLMAGYVAKEKLGKTMDSSAGLKVPVDLWQVTQNFEDGRRLLVEIGMTSGKLVGWKQLLEPSGGDSSGSPLEGGALDRTVQRQADELGIGQLRRAFAGEGDSVRYEADGITVGEARLTVLAEGERLEGEGRLTRFQPVYEVPASYAAYTEEQDRLGERLSLLGNLLPSGVMTLLAIVYAIVMRRFTSFRRGWALALIFLVFYTINNFNLLDGLRAIYGGEVNAELAAMAQLVFMSVLTFAMAVGAYFSLVAGDGLWRAQGRPLWTAGREPGFGAQAWSAMKLAYVLAFVLLGLQTLILGGLSAATGAWATTDVTQSPYNMSALWLMPLLAWCAAIQEEAVYRLFGIGLLMKWIKNPFIASLIPTVIWALGHVTYPIYPSTTRLIELTILGLLFSYLFLKFGFFTAVFTHAIMNSVLMSLSLFMTGRPVETVAGAIYIAAPIAVAWLMRRYGMQRSAAAYPPPA